MMRNTGKESAKMLATMMFTMPGTIFIYQEEEIGMTNVAFKDIGKYRDVETINHYRIATNKGRSKDDVMNDINQGSRDNARTPMQWNDGLNAGFSESTPWINVNPNYKEINVEKALKDPASIYYYYKKLINIRKNNLGLIYGKYKPLLEKHSSVFSYIRKYKNGKYLVVLNFFEQNLSVEIPEDIPLNKNNLIISNYEEIQFNKRLNLRPYESLVFKLS